MRKIFNIRKNNKKPIIAKTLPRNLILAENIRKGVDAKNVKDNNNIAVIGAPGSGIKSHYTKTNLCEMPENTSFVVMDACGEILITTGTLLKNAGYDIKVINLIDFKKTDAYNPFEYIHSETDAVVLADSLYEATKDRSSKDEFIGESYVREIYRALICFVWKYGKDFKLPQNLCTIIECAYTEKMKKYAAELSCKGNIDSVINRLGIVSTPQNNEYFRIVRERLGVLENDNAKKLLSYNTINLNETGEKKTAIFIVYSLGSDDYQFIATILCAQLIHMINVKCVTEKHLPNHIHFFLNDFSSLKFDTNILHELFTRSCAYDMSASIIIQNFQSFQKVYENWKEIIYRCDTVLYYGGLNPESSAFIDELTNKDYGKHNSYSEKGIWYLDINECVCITKGTKPIVTKKFRYFQHRNFKYTADADKNLEYNHQPS